MSDHAQGAAAEQDVLPWLKQAILDYEQHLYRPSAHYLLLFRGAVSEIERLRASSVPAGAEAGLLELMNALKWQASENGCYCETDISPDEAGIPIGERCPYCLMGKACQEIEAVLRARRPEGA